MIVPVPPTGTPEAPAGTAAPLQGGLVPTQRDSAEADGSGKDGTAEAVAVADAVVTDAVVTDAVVTDAVVADAVVTDAVVTDTVAAEAAVAEAAVTDAAADVVAGTTVDHLTATYQAHYRSLLGLAALLLDDTASCEDVVQEAFIRVHSARNRVRDREKTLAYLRQTVVNLSRSALRRRILGLKLLSKPMPDMASAEEGAYDQLERDDLIKAMRGLQRRQREVLVLRYFADMTESQVAETLGISLGSVKAYGSRGIAALRVAMEAAQS